GAYVPLDPAYPVDRLQYMLGDSAPAVLLTHGPLAELFAGTDVPVVDLQTASAAWASEAETDPARGGLSPEHPAYVIYTSGSTGRPKGVLVPHRGLCNVAAAQQRTFGVGPDDRVLQFASLSFDAAAFELVMALASGAALCLAPREELLPGPGLLGVLRRHAVTTVTLPPSALAVLPVEELPALRNITVAGEALPAELVGRWGVRHRLWNLYGPTEATIWSTAAECGDPARKPDIGAPIANVRAYVLDDAMEPVPVGAAGELYVGGAGVARGYLGRPALTAERFVADPFGTEPGARLYRTGDRARWLADGRLDFIGRIDHQVKLRGYRIELGEIESRLMEHPAVREAVVIAREDTPGEKRLVAYVVGGEGAGADVLRAYLGQALPEYMVPAAYLRLDALPVTPNGKLDRRALPAPEGDAYARHAYEAPVGETERALAEIWAEVLGLERVSRHDNFFELGGHSLLAMQVIAYMGEVDLHVEVQALFEAPTPAELARLLAPPVTDAPSDGEPQARGRGDRAIPVRPSGSRPPLFLVHEGAGSTAYAQVLHPHLDPEIPVYALPAPSLSGAPPRTVEGMAARLVRMIREVQPTGPYRVAGWSFGGALAYEIASQLIGEDEAVEFVGMIDSYHPGHPRLAPRDAADENGALLHVARMAQDAGAGARMQADVEAAAPGEAELEAFVARCRAEGRLPAHVTVAHFREMRDHRRAHERALREYRPQPIPVAVHQFPAAESPEPDPSRGWAAVLPASLLQVIPVPGTHLSMMSAPHTGALGAALSGRLDAPRAGGEPGARDASPLMKLRGGKPGVAPLFCVPGAGTSVTSFIELAGCVDPSWPVHGLQPRGMDGGTVPHTTVAAAAEHYLRAVHEACPEGPLHLLGHSFGGWVAFEMALRLREAGRPVASLTILDSDVPDDDGSSIREYDGRDAFLKLVEVLELTAERPLGIEPADAAALDEGGRLKLLHSRML
ncbi:MAG TPA: amino acid adenylation domain-containing protein, partial [Longimicrobium sp.]|nr:amino acid adenylation domain-containing protein [Longimicrobium sp.]